MQINFLLEAIDMSSLLYIEALELDPKFKIADIREKEIEFKIKSNEEGRPSWFFDLRQSNVFPPFSAVEKNQAWTLMPSLVPELALCLQMLPRELNLNWIELEYEKS